MLAGIQYLGIPESSLDCTRAVMQVVQCGRSITRVRILSVLNQPDPGTHGLLLTIGSDDFDPIAIKSGFRSGYRGTGPFEFSYVLQLLQAHDALIEEFDVTIEFLDRLNKSALTIADIEYLNTSAPNLPDRSDDYIFPVHVVSSNQGTLWERFPAIISFGLIDSRIIDLAISFWEDPDERLLTGYRRLEDIVRKRTGLEEHGAKLFSQTFQGPKAKLGWEALDGSEQTGRVSLFTGVYMAYRNPRAYRETKARPDDLLMEFLLLNHLCILEKAAVSRTHDGDS